MDQGNDGRAFPIMYIRCQPRQVFLTIPASDLMSDRNRVGFLGGVQSLLHFNAVAHLKENAVLVTVSSVVAIIRRPLE